MVVLHFEPASKKLPTSLNDVANSKMTAKAIMSSRCLSHPFQERTLGLDQPIKIGRSMARARPSPNNAIFDCKVLSRNHALLWYENGKFFLQDTKSSNGTFVNSQRLSKGSEESPPREVFSGDIVQFGVTVIENSRKGKAIHDCIIATLKLLLSDGKEAKPSPSQVILPSLPSPGTMPTQDLYQISQLVQEALHREQLLQDKLDMLQKIVHTSQEASLNGWKVLIDEDRLFTRIEILENQLQTYSKNFSDDKLREEISKLQDDKNTYQIIAKESLMKMLQEKLDATIKLQDIELSLTNSKSENNHIEEVYECTKTELHELAIKYNNQLEEIQDLNDKLQETEEKHLELLRKLENEKNIAQEKLADLTKQEEFLQAQVESLQADNDYTKGQLTALRTRLDVEQSKQNGDENNVTSEVLAESQDDEVALKTSFIQITPSSPTDRTLYVDDNSKLSERESENDSDLITYKKDINDDDISTSCHENHVTEPDVNNKLKAEVEKLKELLAEAREKKTCIEAEVFKCKELLADTREKKSNSAADVNKVKSELEEISFSAKEFADEFINLRQQLLQGQQIVKEKSEIIAQLQEQLAESVQTNRQSCNETEHLQNVIKHLTEDIQKLKEKEMQPVPQEQSAADSQNTKEFIKLKQDYTSLKNCFQTFEAELRRTKSENLSITADYKKLQDAYKQLENKKCRVVSSDEGIMEELSEARSEADKFRQQLYEIQEEMVQAKEQFSKSLEDKNQLKEDLNKIEEEYELLSYQTRTISACSIIPLILLLFGIVFAFYPTMAKITATTESSYPS